MDSYKSDVVTINCDIDTVFSKLSNPEIFKAQIEKNIDKLPEDAQKNLNKLQFSSDSITLESPMGPLKLVLSEKVQPTRIAFTAADSPVQFGLAITLKPGVDAEHTEAVAELLLKLPVFMRGMVAGQLTDGAKKFGQMLQFLPYKDI